MRVNIYADSGAVGPAFKTERSHFPYTSPDGSKAQGRGRTHQRPTLHFTLGHPCVCCIHYAASVPQSGVYVQSA